MSVCPAPVYVWLSFQFNTNYNLKLIIGYNVSLITALNCCREMMWRT